VARVIALSREHGSGGAEIAANLARVLGWKLLDRALLEEVARRARIPAEEAGACDERVDPWLVRLARGFAWGSADSYAGLDQAGVVDADAVAALTRHVVVETAAAGSCVIVGRGASYALAGRKDVLRVFVYAPLAERVHRLTARGLADAPAEIDRVDRLRAAYVRRYFGCSFGDRACFDLMVDSSLGIDRTVAVLLAAAGDVR
jgi:CMP/dCMP kinase